MINIDMTLKSLSDVIGATGIDVHGSTSRQHLSSMGGLIDAQLSISIFGFDDLFYESVRKSKVYPRLNKTEPLLDIIKDDKTLRVVAHFAGLKKEDIIYEIKEGFVEIGIKENNQMKYVQIPWDVKADGVSVSSTHNNSVFELVFKKI